MRAVRWLAARIPARAQPGAGPPLGPWERLEQRVLDVLPEPLATHPERIVINTAVALLGLSAIFDPNGLRDVWPTWLFYEWVAAMFGGGVSTLVGIFRRKRTLDRLGMLLVLTACLTYAATLVYVLGPHGLIVALIFIGIAVAKAIRVLVTGAVRAGNIQRGHEQQQRAVRKDGDPAGGAR